MEKHVPSIEILKSKVEGTYNIFVSIGKELEHPNTTEHHIDWIGLYFLPFGEKFVKNIGRHSFGAHGNTTLGPNSREIFANPSVTFNMKTHESGELLAISFCNIHGLWQSSEMLNHKE